MQKRLKAVLACLLLVTAVPASGCLGQFALFKKVQKWNGSIDDRWVNTVVHFAFWIVPVYPIILLGDLLIFNTIEFWDDGNNPVAGNFSIKKEDGALVVRIVTETNEYMVRSYNGRRADVYRDGQFIGEGKPDRNGGWVFYDLENQQTRVASAQELAQVFQAAPTSP